MLYGRGVERNEKVAVELMKIAVSAGSRDALVLLGNCYLYGMGVEKDYKKAFSLYSDAADKNNSAGLANVEICLPQFFF